MHREAISDPVWRVLVGLSRLRGMESGYLAGGTGLAIQLGHRVSGDLDFFFKEGIEYHAVLAQLGAAGMDGVVMSLTRKVIPLEELLSLAVEEQKGLRFNLLLFLKGLIDFEEAELDALPLLLWDVTWETVKAELSDEVKALALRWS